MKEITYSDKDAWVLCHNNESIFAIVNLISGQKLSSGQPFIEEFETEEQAKSRVIELTGDIDYFNKNDVQDQDEK